MAIDTEQAGDWLTRTYARRRGTVPISGYFGGHGEGVMASIRKAHPEFSEKRVKTEFYATANARKQNPEDQKAGQKEALKRARKGR